MKLIIGLFLATFLLFSRFRCYLQENHAIKQIIHSPPYQFSYPPAVCPGFDYISTRSRLWKNHLSLYNRLKTEHVASNLVNQHSTPTIDPDSSTRQSHPTVPSSEQEPSHPLAMAQYAKQGLAVKLEEDELQKLRAQFLVFTNCPIRFAKALVNVFWMTLLCFLLFQLAYYRIPSGTLRFKHAHHTEPGLMDATVIEEEDCDEEELVASYLRAVSPDILDDNDSQGRANLSPGLLHPAIPDISQHVKHSIVFGYEL
ncbi:hypothetical protein H0H93_014621 [Arthromyces matolae]|nr:hypothetical protein H0H93_014621 [Arthromyces matolae]